MDDLQALLADVERLYAQLTLHRERVSSDTALLAKDIARRVESAWKVAR